MNVVSNMSLFVFFEMRKREKGLVDDGGTRKSDFDKIMLTIRFSKNSLC